MAAKTNFKLHIAIDFGTDGVGLAYAYLDKVFIHSKWTSSRYADQIKSKTLMLLDGNGQKLASGMDAKFNYISSKRQKDWMLFERFKMALYEQQSNKINTDHDRMGFIFDRINNDIDDDKDNNDNQNINIIKEGYLVKKSKSFGIKRKRWMVIKGKYLYSYPKPNVYENETEIFDLSLWNAIAISNINDMQSFEFKIISIHSTSINEIYRSFVASSNKDMLSWINCIKAVQNYYKKAVNLDIKNELIATNDKTWNIEDIFIETFKYLQIESKSYLNRQKITNINDNEIQWILTVPAIWSDEAKLKMKEWIIKSGIVDANVTDQCKMVYEPDCASLAIHYQIYKNKNIKKNQNDQKVSDNVNNEWIAGEKYILIDAGGGVVDIAYHEILDEFGVKEVLAPSGGPWGSCYIDDQYIILLNKIFSTEWMNEFKQISPTIYVDIIHNFQNAKCIFYEQKTDIYHCRLPFEFLNFLQEKMDDNDKELKDIIKNCEIMGKTNMVTLNDEYLDIKCEIWEYMFDQVINPIITHIKILLINSNIISNTKYLCMVGGMSSSKYFQYKMENEFGLNSVYKLKLIIPSQPILSVLEGAAYFGISRNSNYIKARRLQRTYGTAVCKTWYDATQMNISTDYIEENKEYDVKIKETLVKGCFAILAVKNQEIYNGIVFKQYINRRHNKNFSIIRICWSDIENPKTINDGFELAKCKIEYTDKNLLSDKIVCEFHFYGTLLKIYAYSQSTPNNKTEVSILLDGGLGKTNIDAVNDDDDDDNNDKNDDNDIDQVNDNNNVPMTAMKVLQ